MPQVDFPRISAADFHQEYRRAQVLAFVIVGHLDQAGLQHLLLHVDCDHLVLLRVGEVDELVVLEVGSFQSQITQLEPPARVVLVLDVAGNEVGQFGVNGELVFVLLGGVILSVGFNRSPLFASLSIGNRWYRLGHKVFQKGLDGLYFF